MERRKDRGREGQILIHWTLPATTRGPKNYPSQSVKYLRIEIDKNLNRKHHVHNIAENLKRKNALVVKIKNSGPLKTH